MILLGKNILITGAGKGIGYECVKTFIREGAFVFALIKSKKDIAKFKDFSNKNYHLTVGNVTDQKYLKKIFLESKKTKKLINGIVNNAGLRFRKKFLKIKKKEIYNIFNVNYFSIFETIQNFIKYFPSKKNKSIVNIGSIVGQIGFDELSIYGSTKGALLSLTKCLATELAPKKIRVNCVSPGFTKTSYYKNFAKKKKLLNWTLSRIPMKRWGNSQEIADLIAFLISDKSSYINGENINIDGGWLNS